MKAKIEVRYELVGGEKPCVAKVYVSIPIWLRSKSRLLGEPVTKDWGKPDVDTKTRTRVLTFGAENWEQAKKAARLFIKQVQEELPQVMQEYEKLEKDKPNDYTIEFDENGEWIIT